MCNLTRKPLLQCDANGEYMEIATRKLFVANIPLSFSNEDITKSSKQTGGAAALQTI